MMAFFHSNQHLWIGILRRCFFLVKNYFAATIRSYGRNFPGEQFGKRQMCSKIDVVAWTVASGVLTQGNNLEERKTSGNLLS